MKQQNSNRVKIAALATAIVALSVSCADSSRLLDPSDVDNATIETFVKDNATREQTKGDALIQVITTPDDAGSNKVD